MRALQEKLVVSARFPRRARIHSGDDFKNILGRPDVRVSRSTLVLFARANQLQYARLGIAVSKKKTALAVQRHRIKRLLRESFRVRAHALGGMDIVALVRGEIKAQSNKKIFGDLNFLWRQLQKKSKPQTVGADARNPAVSD